MMNSSVCLTTITVMVQLELLRIASKTIFPGGSDGKVSLCNAGDPVLIPRLGRSTGGGNGSPLQYSTGKSHGRRSLVVYGPWGCQKEDTTE